MTDKRDNVRRDMFGTFFGDGWATPVTSKSWAALASLTQLIKRASGYRLAVRVHHFAWERSHGDRSRRHPWQSLRA
jgi:hypothetical protein